MDSHTTKKQLTKKQTSKITSGNSSKKSYPAKKRPRSEEDDDPDYEEKKPAAKRARWTFPASLRQEVLRTAPVNKDNFHVCPPCGRPLMSKGTEEEVIAPWSIKENKAKGRPAGLKKVMVSAQLDHYFKGKTWAQYYDEKKLEGKSDADMRDAYLNPANLRPMCYPCNVGHKYEGKKINLRKDYSKDGYESDDEDRHKDVYKRISNNKALMTKKQFLTKYPQYKKKKRKGAGTQK